VKSKIAENFRKHFRITDEDRKRLTPEEIASLEEFAKKMMEDCEPATSFNERKFDASDDVISKMPPELRKKYEKDRE
jgi:hypothetical protein